FLLFSVIIQLNETYVIGLAYNIMPIIYKEGMMLTNEQKVKKNNRSTVGNITVCSCYDCYAGISTRQQRHI
ncbi:MAG: hypothetical protein MJ177_00005, partial [Clostridia bacterium]|nr:hypothetical protein [Clostridia bacterium]